MGIDTSHYVSKKQYSKSAKVRIGFIGLGTMGAAMAGHLAVCGHTITVFNRTRKKTDLWLKAFSNFKVKAAIDLHELANDADFVVSCVGNDNDLSSVTISETGCFKYMKKGSIYIDHSTTSATIAQKIFVLAKKKQISFFDAPISGGNIGAESGNLSVMCGGDSKYFHLAKALAKSYAKKMVLVGPSGSGQLTKMVNQICISGLIQSLSEGINFGIEAGLNMEVVLNLISSGAAQSWQMENRGKTMITSKYDFGFAVKLMCKDLGLILNEATSRGIKLPTTEIVNEYYKQMLKQGMGDLDTSALLLRLQKSAKFGVRGGT